MDDDTWEMFCEMCRQVVTEGNVYLDVTVYDHCVSMTLWPYEFYNEEDEDE